MNMKKTIEELKDIYPDIRWSEVEPTPDILNTYGDGTILKGKFNGKEKDFFILAEDENKLRWGVVIAHNLFGMEPIEEK